MIRVFSSQDDYVEFLVDLPLLRGEVFCSTFLPSCLFPRDSIDLYFSRTEVPDDPGIVTERLWEYGRRVRRAVMDGTAILCIEVSCIRRMCKTGVVHECTPVFTLTYPTRIEVLRTLQTLNREAAVYVTPGPIPFVFRLHPPSGVLVDVLHNVAAQMVQGIWLKDGAVFSKFAEEA
ncbi:MAG TPA: hypothetical protein ENH11_03315, partial [Candidatus Acetothermia bacterium]|nr:hypothetical protein [Candidatus Acetothermia bacterium]